MPWLWVCHKCNTRYPLGSTRRCLYDGHHFCGGTTTNPITGRTKRHRACGSEFDYVGWEELGYWREKLQQAASAAAAADPSKPISHHHHTKRNCAAQCIYPSACHWRAKEAKAREQRAMQEQKAREQAAAAKKASFDFLDASCFEQDPLYCPKSGGGERNKAATPQNASEIAVGAASRKKTGNYFKGLVRAAEKGTSSISTLLNPTATPTSSENTQQELPRSLRIVDPTKTHQNNSATNSTTTTAEKTTTDPSSSAPSLAPSTHRRRNARPPPSPPTPTATTSPLLSPSSSSSSSSSPTTSPLPSPISPLTDPTTTTTTTTRHPSLAFSTDETDGAAVVVSPLSPPDWGWLDGASRELGVEIVMGGSAGRRGSAPARGNHYQIEMDIDDDDDKEREESMEEWQKGVDAVERRVSV
ncbi:MAG: hypothetical protein OHK93_001096 [Ramalina farinacea]|uniref:Uncharacterized protein n=1 Tax=Ramalina farinacea TaxID=258253 RepID=A0AA43QNU7_9LECA|nr:hypothetical protein [Ramalina farinacea]